MNKAKIILEASENNILNERIFLAKMHSPFVVSLLCSFQNQLNLFLVLELLTGGDLRYHFLNYAFYFTEKQFKFLLTNIILGLEYIHKKGVVHRDMKPENVIFNSKGYLKITDFGISCYKKNLDKNDDSGTPAYMAPETIKGDDQDYSVDFYSLGVIGYEIMKGIVPYDSNDREEIKYMMKKNVIKLTKETKLKATYSELCLDFINKLLKKDPDERLGSKEGEKELKEHPFFSGIDWDMIQNMKFKSPLYDIIEYSRMKHGNVQELFDFEYCNKSDGLSPGLAKMYINITKRDDYKAYFQYYTCVCVENIISELNKDENRKKKRKKLKRSQSMNDNDYEFKYKYTQNFNLPYINNNLNDIYRQNGEMNLRNSYQSNLLNHQNYLSKLNYDYNLKNSQLNFMNFPFPYPQNDQFSLNNNCGLFPNVNQSYLPMIGQNNMNYMNKIMTKFYKKMNEDRNNFFVNNNRKNNMFNFNNYEVDNKSNYYQNDSDKEGFNFNQYNSSQFYNNPYYSSLNYNPYYFGQITREKEKIGNKSNRRKRDRYHTKRRSKMINKEEISMESEEKDE